MGARASTAQSWRGVWAVRAWQPREQEAGKGAGHLGWLLRERDEIGRNKSTLRKPTPTLYHHPSTYPKTTPVVPSRETIH